MYKRKTPAFYASKLKRRFMTDDPFEIAKSLNIKIFTVPLGNISGYYKYLKKHKCIYINSDIEDDHFARLVMAHELGHAVMHPKENCYFLENRTMILVSKNELEANKFAMELLISNESLMEYSDYTINQLSKIYGYHEKLIELRLNG